jgi:formamidase
MVRIDRTKKLKEQPHIGHNRWHPNIRPAARARVGDIVGIETFDCTDGEVQPDWVSADIGRRGLPGLVHPMTGPIFVEGAEPGDLLEVKILEIVPEAVGHTMCGPMFGFLREFLKEPFLVHWDLRDGFATSAQIPGVRIPPILHMGVMGVAPSMELLRAINAREKELMERGGSVHPPTAEGAVPADPAIASEACRTFAPHENGGNLDIKQLTPGTTLRLPVHVEGALFSTGDAHFAQGDGESSGTAIEIGATVFVKFNILKGAAKERGIRDVQYYRDEPAEQLGCPRRFFATTGISHNPRGQSLSEDLNMATKNALLNMIEYLHQERGFTRMQAYTLCSVAVDLKISQLVDLPNVMVSAMVPLDIFV